MYQNLLEKSTVKSPTMGLHPSLSESEHSVEAQQPVFLAECQEMLRNGPDGKLLEGLLWAWSTETKWYMVGFGGTK